MVTRPQVVNELTARAKQHAFNRPTERRRGGLRRAGTAGSACRSTCGRETGHSGDRRALRLGQPALPAAPARRRPPGRFSFVGGLSAVCLDPRHRQHRHVVARRRRRRCASRTCSSMVSRICARGAAVHRPQHRRDRLQAELLLRGVLGLRHAIGEQHQRVARRRAPATGCGTSRARRGRPPCRSTSASARRSLRPRAAARGRRS